MELENFVFFVTFVVKLNFKFGFTMKTYKTIAFITLLITSFTFAQQNASIKAEQRPVFTELEAVNNSPATATLGSLDKNSGYKFQIEFTNTGAAIEKATFSTFTTRDKNPKPLTIIQPAFAANGQKISPLSNSSLLFVDAGQRLPLDKLNWKMSPVTSDANSQSVKFEALIKAADSSEVLKLIKTFTVRRDSYQVDFNITLVNLSNQLLLTNYDLIGPLGLNHEDIRPDIRAVGAFIDPANQRIESTKIDLVTVQKAADFTNAITHKKPQFKFLWSAVSNKYFTGILRPVPATGAELPAFVSAAQTFAVDTAAPANIASKDPLSTTSLALRYRVIPTSLESAGKPGSSQSNSFQLYLGPKDKDIFEASPLYTQLGYYHAIDFNACFCAFGLIDPLSFAILALMKWAFAFIPNYGLIIIILVLLVRLALHPITKSSQVSMMKMSKLGPMAEEIRKKYADNKQEMNRRMMELYREHGTSPILGCLPMLLQMPIWIALYSAIYAGIELRNAEFLPVWITDLSGPDAIYRFAIVNIPLLGTMIGPISSINLLPILLAIAFYLQQKLTPMSAGQPMSDAMKQQQKMMLVMMPVMMLLVLYNAPSGLNLYIMASTFGGIIEQYVIRKHIRERDEAQAQVLVPTTSKAGGKAKKPRSKPFFKS